MESSKAPGYLHLSFRGRGSAMQMLLTNLLPLGRKPCWRGGSTASRQLSEVEHVPAQVALWLVTALGPCAAASRQLSEVKHVPAAPEIEPGTSAKNAHSPFIATTAPAHCPFGSPEGG